jgi:neopullulanase
VLCIQTTHQNKSALYFNTTMKNILLAFVLFLTSNPIFAQNIQRIEPANWWVGMRYNTITLLVYGDNIGHLQPSIVYKGVQLVKNETVENKNYLFITLKIGATAKPGTLQINFKDKGKIVLSRDFPLLARAPNSANRASFSPKDVMYLIVPDRFANGDPSNDAVPALLEKTFDRSNEIMRHGGDIQGIINHLDYMQALGITQIWCTPLIENDEPQYSYHGYAGTDFYKIDPRFGSNEQMVQLSKAAKQRGIGIVWDVVLNHCGSAYYFVKDLPSKDWVNFPEAHTRCNFYKSTLNDLYATEIDKQEYTDGWFDHHMADMNQRNPLVAKYLTQNTLWWIEYAGLSGFREDTYSFADKDFLAQWSKTITDEYPNFNIVGEEMSRNPVQIAYWQKGKANPDGYRSYLPTTMDFLLTDNVVAALTTPTNWANNWGNTYEGVGQDYLFPNPNNQLIFPDNHDLDRFYTRINKNLDDWKMGMALFATMRGIPQLYYGTEVLMTNEKLGHDGLRRGDFYGGWSGDTKNATTGQGLTTDEQEAKAYLTLLLNWRKNTPAITEGKFIHYAPQRQKGVYVYFRYTDKQKVMVVLNKSTEATTLDMKRFSQMVPSAFSAKEVLSGQQVRIDGKLEVPAGKALIFEVY